MKVWAIGGGKGGIGKSFVITNLAITLAKQNKKVVIVDFDFGGANLHTCLGVSIPRKNLNDVLMGSTLNIKDLLTDTPVGNLKFISGADSNPGTADISTQQIRNIITQLRTLDCDYVLLDLGAGTHQNTLEAFVSADKSIIAITPEPTSIENAYRFIKTAHYTLLKNLEKKLNLKSVIDYAMESKNKMGIRTPSDLLEKVCQISPKEGAQLKEQVEKFNLHLILNQVRSMSDIDTAYSVQAVCKKYFGIKTTLVGHIDHDNAVWQSVRKHRPVVLEHPYSQLVMVFNQIAKSLEKDEDVSGTNLLRAA